MKRTDKPRVVQVSAFKGHCTMFATVKMQCPLCKLMIPANTPHSCTKG